MLTIGSFVLGLVFGSFFNVAGLRLSKKQSIIHPPSHCPSCNHRLAPIDLIPVVSYLLLKGKCRYCRGKIAVLYPAIELVTACLFAAATFAIDSPAVLFLSWALISLLIIIIVSDISYMIIPDKVLVFFASLLLIFQCWMIPVTKWWQPITGAMVGFAVPFFIAVITRGNIGGGDIKLFAVLGFVLGWKGVLVAFFFSTFYGALIGGVGLVTGILRKRKPIPFGPFIALGALTAYFFGDAILNWYVHFF